MATQPKDFGFGEDATMLRDSARKFFSDNCSADKIHRLVAGDPDMFRDNNCNWDESLWQQVVELGWLAACVPEAAGGIGMPLVAAVGLAEEAGRAAYPAPLLTTFMSTFVLKACGTPTANAALAAIAEGTPTTLAVTNSVGSLEFGDTDVTVATDGTLTGTACYVQEARKCSQYVVSAQGAGGVGLYLVQAAAPGVSVNADAIIDLTRDQARLVLADAAAVELAPPGAGPAALDAALPAMLCLLSADLVGTGEWLLQTTVEYAQTRVQFDRPLGFFQAVKHPLVNVMLDIDRAKSLTYSAACALDTGAKDALELARMAKSQASDMGVFAASRAVQFHGGIGFTWECYVHLFFKRAMHSQTLLGDARHHRTKLADVLIGRAA